MTSNRVRVRVRAWIRLLPRSRHPPCAAAPPRPPRRQVAKRQDRAGDFLARATAIPWFDDLPALCLAKLKREVPQAAEARSRTGLSQPAFARLLGVSPRTHAARLGAGPARACWRSKDVAPRGREQSGSTAEASNLRSVRPGAPIPRILAVSRSSTCANCARATPGRSRRSRADWVRASRGRPGWRRPTPQSRWTCWSSRCSPWGHLATRSAASSRERPDKRARLDRVLLPA